MLGFPFSPGHVCTHVCKQVGKQYPGGETPALAADVPVSIQFNVPSKATLP